MKKDLPAINNQEKRLASALHFHQLANASAAQMAVAAAKAGMELKAIKKDVGHGGWEEYFNLHLGKHGMNLRTAQRYMALADGLKGKALKNDSGTFLELLETAPSELKPADQEKLTKAVSKMTDGATLTELYMDMGIVKKPQGSGAKGGNTRKDKDEADETGPKTAEELAAEKSMATVLLINLLKEALLDKPFNAATKKQRTELQGLLIDVTAAVKETL